MLRIGTGVLLFYKTQLLILQPVYASDWLLPGGSIEAEESPMDGTIREVRENLNITVTPTHVLAVDYVSNKDIKGEYLSFLFGAIDLSEHQAQNLSLSRKDYREYKFVDIETACSLLVAPVARRVQSALKAATENYTTVYLEDGRIPKISLQLQAAPPLRLSVF